MVCGKSRTWLQGIFCVNFSRNNSSSQVCRSAWCGSCYTSRPEGDFYVKTLPSDEDENNTGEDANRLQPSWGSKTQAPTDFKVARNGDHLLVPFECDLCVFRKLKRRVPNDADTADTLLLACIRQANLDAFWSRASSTVKANLEKTKLGLELSSLVGLDGPYHHSCFLPGYDHCGYQVAIQMLLASKRPGKYAATHSQYDTIRKVRTAYSNFARASSQANSSVLAFSDDRGKAERIVNDPVSSYWFSKFFAGCRRRMGQDWRPNLALSTELIIEVLNRINQKVIDENQPENKHSLVVLGSYIAITYVLSLRGPEGLLLDLAGLRRYQHQVNDHHCIIALRGKVKGEHSDRCHLLPCCLVTSSGIQIKRWVNTLIEVKESMGQHTGPAISDLTRKILTTGYLDFKLVSLLEEVHDEAPHLFPSNIKTNKDEIGNCYQVFRSLRRSSDTRAIEKNISRNDIDTVNRWHGTEQAMGSRPYRPMYQHYAQVDLLIKPFLRYTSAMKSSLKSGRQARRCRKGGIQS
jgi:hypothetical protein